VQSTKPPPAIVIETVAPLIEKSVPCPLLVQTRLTNVQLAGIVDSVTL
jgi:hypothetical protein